LSACFVSNGCPEPDFTGNGYQDAPQGFQDYTTAMQNWYNGLPVPTQQCISGQMMTAMQNAQNLGNCIPSDLVDLLTGNHKFIFNKGNNNQDQLKQQAVASSNARIAAAQCGKSAQIDQCLQLYKSKYYTPVVCKIKTKCMQKKLSPGCQDHINQEMNTACPCLQQHKQQVIQDADKDSVSASQKYYNDRKTDLNNACIYCHVDLNSVPQLTDYFKSTCPQVGLGLGGNTNTQSGGSLLGLFNSNSLIGNQIQQINALPEYGCVGLIAKGNQPKFDEMNQRFQAVSNDEPVICNC